MRRLLLILSLAAAVAARAEPTGDEALQAQRAGALPAFGKRVEEGLRQELSQAAPKKPDESAVVRLAALRALAARFATTKPASSQEAETLDWAVRHATVGPMLLTAVSARDDPGRVLTVLTALRTTFGKAVEQFPDLAVASCVVWDSPAREGQTPAQATQAACDVFGHLVQNRRALRFDPQALPWQVLVYLVDSRVTPEERRWALTTYRLPLNPGMAYFEIRYDVTGFYSGKWLGAGGTGAKSPPPYTLPNILKLGGVCKDEAHFTAEVCRAYGIPATVCTSQSGAGEGFHAWVGILSIARNSRSTVFDFQTAHYADHGYWSGTVIDPQTGQALSDGEAAMAADWTVTSPPRRLYSIALAQSLDLLADAAQRTALAKVAIEAAPANRQAWAALAAECTRAQAPPTAAAELGAVVERFALGRYDDFAFKIFAQLIATRPPEEQLKTLDRATGLFPNRPDLVAELRLLKGDVLNKAGRPVDALRQYQQLLEKSLQFGPIALESMSRVEALLRPAGKIREIVEHYRIAWTHMAVSEASGYAWTTPWYLMGERLARVLDETGDRAGAERVRQTIRAKDSSRHDLAGK